jgi:hypothetical protein
MTPVPEALAPASECLEAEPARERVAADVPAGVARRLRMWAALRGQRVAHVVSDVVCQAVPTAEQLADLMRNGGSDDPDDH